MTSNHEISVLFVCLGNICRSPLAEGILLHRLAAAGLSDRVRVDSAGTGSWHVGQRPDTRSIGVAAKHGIDLPGTARRVRLEDFFEFQFVFAMDGSNLQDLQDLESGSESHAVIRLLLEFDPEAAGELDVPDPYYGGPGGFDNVYEMVDRACEALVEHLEQQLGA
jgi:protein-tyrosine phosphatase